MIRILLIAIGYLCGLIETGYLVGKAHGIDIREHGSGNAGATNSLRVMGPKAGLLVFLGDFLKCLIPCLVTGAIFAGAPDGLRYVYMSYVGIGVILGHDFPVTLGFKGGKGVASTVGFMAAVDIRAAIVLIFVFLAVTAVTQYVSLASMIILTGFVVLMFIGTGRGDPALGAAQKTEFLIICAAAALLSIYLHRSNIVRLIKGTENKTVLIKKKGNE